MTEPDGEAARAWLSPPPPHGRRVAQTAVGLDLAAVALAVVGVPFLVVGWGLLFLSLALLMVVVGGVLGLVAAAQALRGSRQGRTATLALASW